MAFTFTTLKTAIEDYTDNSESTFVSQLTRFILNAEERILKECQLDVFRKNVAGSLTASNKFLTKPTDFLAPFSLSVPLYYADWNDETLLVAPTPSSALNVELHYFYRPESITAASSGTTWLGDNAELALLYGALVEAYIFMKGEQDILSAYESRFQESIRWLKNLGEGLQTRDEYRYDRVRRDVA